MLHHQRIPNKTVVVQHQQKDTDTPMRWNLLLVRFSCPGAMVKNHSKQFDKQIQDIIIY